MCVFGRLFTKKQCWVPTWRGWVLVIVVLGALFLGAIHQVYPFLAPTERVEAELLIIEGWLPDSSFIDAIQEYKSHNYQSFVTTGGSVYVGFDLATYKTQARLGAAILQKHGIKASEIFEVPAPDVIRDRTYACAVAVRDWLTASNQKFQSANLFSLGPHSRRSWLLYQKALGDDFKVGIIAGRDRDYDATRWWASSSGVRVVLSELNAYIYARLFFHPDRMK